MTDRSITRRRLIETGAAGLAGLMIRPSNVAASSSGRGVKTNAGRRLDRAVDRIAGQGGEGEIWVKKDQTKFPDCHLTVERGTTLRFERGNRITVNGGQFLIVAGEIDAGPYQIFDIQGDGIVVCAPGGETCAVRPEWWGPAAPGGQDWTAAIQSAIDFFLGLDGVPADRAQCPPGDSSPDYTGGTVLFRSAEYGCLDEIVLRDGVALLGCGTRSYGRLGTVLKLIRDPAPGAIPVFVRTVGGGYNEVRIEDLSIQGNAVWTLLADPNCPQGPANPSDPNDPNARCTPKEPWLCYAPTPGGGSVAFTDGAADTGLLLEGAVARLRNVHIHGFNDTALEIQGGINSSFERVRAGAASICLRLAGAQTTTQSFNACWFVGALAANVEISGSCSSIWFGGGTVFETSNGVGVVLADRIDGGTPTGNVGNITFDTCHWENIRGTYLRAGTSAAGGRVESLRVKNPLFSPGLNCMGFTENGPGGCPDHYVFDLGRVGWADVEIPLIQSHHRTLLNMTGETMRVIYRTPTYFPLDQNNYRREFGPGVDDAMKSRIYRFGIPHTGAHGAVTWGDHSRLYVSEGWFEVVQNLSTAVENTQQNPLPDPLVPYPLAPIGPEALGPCS